MSFGWWGHVWAWRLIPPLCVKIYENWKSTSIPPGRKGDIKHSIDSFGSRLLLSAPFFSSKPIWENTDFLSSSCDSVCSTLEMRGRARVRLISYLLILYIVKYHWLIFLKLLTLIIWVNAHICNRSMKSQALSIIHHVIASREKKRGLRRKR